MAFEFDFKFDVDGAEKAQSDIKKTGAAWDDAGEEAVKAADDFDKAAAKSEEAAKRLGEAGKEGGQGISETSRAMGDALGPAQEMFAVTDRVTSILGAAAGAAALGVLAYEGLSAALELVTHAQEYAAEAAAITNGILEAQASTLEAVTARVTAAQEVLGAYATTQELVDKGREQDLNLVEEQAAAVAKLAVFQEQEAGLLGQLNYRYREIEEAGGMYVTRLNEYGQEVRVVNSLVSEHIVAVQALEPSLDELRLSMTLAKIQAEFFTGALQASSAESVSLAGSVDLLSFALGGIAGNVEGWGAAFSKHYTGPVKAATKATADLLTAQDLLEDAMIKQGEADLARIDGRLRMEEEARKFDEGRAKEDAAAAAKASSDAQARVDARSRELEAMRVAESAAQKRRIQEEIALSEARWQYATEYAGALNAVSEAAELAGFSSVTVQRLGLVADGIRATVSASKETAASIASYAARDFWGGTQHALAAASFTVAAGAAAKGLGELGGSPSGSGAAGGGGATAGAPSVPTTSDSTDSRNSPSSVTINIGGPGVYGSREQLENSVARGVQSAWGRDDAPRYTSAARGRSPSDFRS